jgi:hypothetical protein
MNHITHLVSHFRDRAKRAVRVDNAEGVETRVHRLSTKQRDICKYL